MLIGHRKERNSLRWPIYIINSVDRTKVAINSDQIYSDGFDDVN